MKRLRNQQQGVMLIEALVGVLIFAIGILALIGLQTAAVSATIEAKSRSDASFLAEQIIATMWGDSNANIPAYDTVSGSSPKMLAWKTDVSNKMTLATGANAPTIRVVASDGGFDVTVSIFWAKPGDESSPGVLQQHKHVAQTRIDFNS